MNLLIVSSMAHYVKNGQIVGHGPTAREIAQLATLFEHVNHIACLHSGEPSDLMLPYEAHNIHLLPVPPSGGETLRDKLNIIRFIPRYVRTILKELPRSDVIHVRCPSNICLIAVVLLTFVRYPRLRWVKYAGNWSPARRETWSYTFQRLWINTGLHRGVVTVNGTWQRQPPHVHTFYNPCLTDIEIAEGEAACDKRKYDLPLRLIFVGHLHKGKGAQDVLQIAAELQRLHIEARLDIVGDGPQRTQLEAQARELGIAEIARFHGWLPRTLLGTIYQEAQFLILPTRSEGWPKVLSEAMAYGVIPLAGNVSSIPQYLKSFKTGRAIPSERIDGYVEAIVWYSQHPREWQEEARNGARAAHLFTYSHYLKSVRQLLGL